MKAGCEFETRSRHTFSNFPFVEKITKVNVIKFYQIYASYRQFVMLKYGRPSREDCTVIPSFRAWINHNVYPSQDGVYTGLREKCT